MATPDPVQAEINALVGGAASDISDVRSGNVTGAVINTAGIVEKLAAQFPALKGEAKAGYKTTEFWGGVAGSLYAALGSNGWVPKVVVGAVAAIYAAARAFTKASAQSAARRA